MTPLDALQAALAGEHAAVYVYGVLGGRVSASAEQRLWTQVRDAYAAHQERRDQLTGVVHDAGAAPVAAEVSYRLPTPAGTAVEVRSAALEIERRCTAIYAEMVGSTSGAHRQWALQVLENTAVRQLTFGGKPEAFPGVGEL